MKKLIILFFLSLIVVVFSFVSISTAQETIASSWDLKGSSCTEEEYRLEINNINDSINPNCNCSEYREPSSYVYGQKDFYCKSNIAAVMASEIPDGYGWCINDEGNYSSSAKWWCDPNLYGITGEDLAWFYEGPRCSLSSSFEPCGYDDDDDNFVSAAEPTFEQTQKIGEECVYDIRYTTQYKYSSCSQPEPDEDSSCLNLNVKINGLPGQRIRVRGNLCS